MNLFFIMSLLSVIIGMFCCYLYSAFYLSDTEGKSFFQPTFDKKICIYTAIIACIAIGLTVYSNVIHFYNGTEMFINSWVVCLIACMAWIDYRKGVIPNALIVVGLVITLVNVLMKIFVNLEPIQDILFFTLTGGAVWGGLFIVIALLLKKALGMGDAKMFLVLGLNYGLNGGYAILFISVLIMAIVAIVLLLMKKVDRKSALPMAPFVLIGYLICAFIGF